MRMEFSSTIICRHSTLPAVSPMETFQVLFCRADNRFLLSVSHLSHIYPCSSNTKFTHCLLCSFHARESLLSITLSVASIDQSITPFTGFSVDMTVVETNIVLVSIASDILQTWGPTDIAKMLREQHGEDLSWSLLSHTTSYICTLLSYICPFILYILSTPHPAPSAHSSLTSLTPI